MSAPALLSAIFGFRRMVLLVMTSQAQSSTRDLSEMFLVRGFGSARKLYAIEAVRELGSAFLLRFSQINYQARRRRRPKLDRFAVVDGRIACEAA